MYGEEAGIESQPGKEAQPVQVMPEILFQFHGSGGGYFKIWMVNVFLSIITLGVYSAWAKVRRKQYFYGNTRLASAAFQYLADPVKILKGRAVVFSAFIVYSVITRMVPLAAPLFMLLLFLAIPWVVVRSLAFNARNSAWRNIRFNFKGTYGGAAKAFILWPLLVPFTLGAMMPYVLYCQKKFVVENSWYGTTAFTFHAKPGDYYGIVLRFAIPAFLLLVLAGVAVSLVLSGFPGSIPEVPCGQTLASLVPLMFMGGLYLCAFVYFGVKFSNLLFNSGGLARHRFRAFMKIGPYAGIVFTNTIATVFTLGLFHPFAQIRSHRYKMENLALVPGDDLDRFVTDELTETSALGGEMSDILDFDFGL